MTRVRRVSPSGLRVQAGSLVFCSICLRALRPPLSPFLSPRPDLVLKSCLRTVYLSGEEGERKQSLEMGRENGGRGEKVGFQESSKLETHAVVGIYLRVK